MGRVSSKPVKKKVLEKISAQFAREIASLRTDKESEKFINALLTKNEKIMLSKRLTLIYMLARGYSFSAITKTLKIHPPTISRYGKQMRNDEFEDILRHIKSEIKKPKSKQSPFWLRVEAFFQMTYTPYGAPRWKGFYEGMEKLEQARIESSARKQKRQKRKR